MRFVDRLLTIIATITLTSAFWIVAGGSLLDRADSASQRNVTRPAEAAPSPPVNAPVAVAEGETAATTGATAPALDTRPVSAPSADTARTLLIPVLNIRAVDLSDTYSDARGGAAQLHEAIDIMAPKGTSVQAAAPGVVEKLYSSQAGGKTIYIRSPDRETIHYYAHLDQYAEGLREGQQVRRGQRLGSVGSSGNASDQAPHLHFAILQTTPDAEWWEPANAVNPFPLLTGGDRAGN